MCSRRATSAMWSHALAKVLGVVSSSVACSAVGCNFRTIVRVVSIATIVSRVQVVGVLEPLLHFGVDPGDRFDWDPVRDPVLLFESSGFDQPAGGLHVTQGKAQVDTARGRRPDFGEDMLAIDWNDRLARADFHVRTQPAGHLEDLLKDWPDAGSLAFEHCLHIAFGRLEIGFRVTILHPLSLGTLCDPPRGI